MGDEHVDFPFAAEYAKSGRASCKLCSGAIAKDSLRVAVMVQSPKFDGKIPNWYHFRCVWKRARITSHTEIKGFDSLRWEDQEKLKESIAGGGGKGGLGKGENTSQESNFYATEYAKSGRSQCRGCDDKIGKDAVRVSKKDFESQRAKMYGPQDLWYHIDCFVEHRDEVDFDTSMDPTKIKGYQHLRKEDKDELLSKLGKPDKSKRKGDELDGATKPKKQKSKETKEEKALREQSQALWKIRDQLTKEVSKDAMKALLEFNGQGIPTGESNILDALSDCMVFGALKTCPECKDGQLKFSSSGAGYRCTGDISAWTKCQYTTAKPERKDFKVPKEFHDVDFLKKYKCSKHDRVLAADRMMTEGATSSATGAGPLQGMTFVIDKGVKSSPKDLEYKIKRMGGQVVETVDKGTMAVVSIKEHTEKPSKLVKSAKKHDVHVVGEGFFEACSKGGAALLIPGHSLADWGGDPHERIKDVVDGPPAKKSMKSMAAKRDEQMFTKSVPAKVKMTVKGGAAVDPDSGLESKTHVLLEKNGEPYTAVLNLVDIARGTNSYYKLQILEGDSKNSYWVFRSWGRVGTTIGDNKLERKGSKQSALETFKEVYYDKTGNEWEERKDFVKHPKKFFPIDIDYGDDDEEVRKLDASAGSKSNLSSPVQNLIKMIFDVESMKKAMLEFEIDLKKMPLGKLSKKQIESAFKVLKALQGLVDSGGSATQFLDKSNQFYTLIPHDFGLEKPPLIDTEESIKVKSEMLENLLEIEVAYSLLKGGDKEKDPLDAHYEQLKTKIVDMKADDEEYKMLVEYVKNTHAATHNQFDLEVEEIFKIDRSGERKKYRAFEELHNRQLLWHGSRTTNYAGILSQGLRIAPPEAPVTGYMFGKGVYFADMVSKSANYCRTSKSNPIGYLLLCEVALGNMHELTAADYVTKLPKGKHSTKGIGMTYPDECMNKVTEKGVIIPMGTAKKANQRSSLLYNEFIVYDTAQINMKYMLQVNFKYKW